MDHVPRKLFGPSPRSAPSPSPSSRLMMPTTSSRNRQVATAEAKEARAAMASAESLKQRVSSPARKTEKGTLSAPSSPTAKRRHVDPCQPPALTPATDLFPPPAVVPQSHVEGMAKVDVPATPSRKSSRKSYATPLPATFVAGRDDEWTMSIGRRVHVRHEGGWSLTET